ncbi:TIGR02281 family clan AA aspartic protease [Sphingomonas rhizophila]|uniref:TIGR02281 family clan AA aspartic protease n=1 Tax=Sphingomonas rhizophila TaxID=2071607 RepID=A0A7G9SDG7_9SPHN|nr:TIGR02281 family clan AA aspartic protease [Sphingomonas rhizophila]QNN65892.1 TIGR02281 family clan AA aspartic protease [Sphingomonas rhizophila]
MTNDVMLGSLYLLMAMMLVLGALINRREPIAKLFTMLLAWVAIFGAGFVIFSFRDDLAYVGERLRAEATGAPLVDDEGGAVRIPMAIDGHFWLQGSVNGIPARFLVDSGATMTTIDRQTAQRAKVSVGAADQMVRTGNGIIKVSSGRADELRIASIERRNVGLHIAETDDMNVLGMNYLSSLKRWGVEGRWLVLEP